MTKISSILLNLWDIWNTFWTKIRLNHKLNRLENTVWYEESSHPIMVTDLDGQLLRCNDAAEQRLQWPEPSGSDHTIFDFFHEQSSPRIQSFLENDVDYQPYTSHDLMVPAYKGNRSATIIKFYKHSGDNYCIFLLESSEIHREVLITREEFHWLSQLKTMLFGISHELKTPLATAKGYAGLMDDNQVEVHRLQDALDNISEILDNMTHPLASLKHDRHENSDDEPIYISIHRAVKEFRKMVSYMDQTKRFVGDFEVSSHVSEDVYVPISQSRFHQVLSNLFENAMRAVNHRGREGSIHIEIDMCDDHRYPCVLLHFRDNGVGMDEETQSKLFTPYFTTRDSEQSGSGLGGYFIQQFVSNAGGHIDIESQKGDCTAIHLHFPYRRRDQLSESSIQGVQT